MTSSTSAPARRRAHLAAAVLLSSIGALAALETGAPSCDARVDGDAPAAAPVADRVASATAAPAEAAGPVASTRLDATRLDAQGIYLLDRVMVRPTPDADLDAIAAAVGAEVARPVGRSGYAALAVAPEAHGDALAALQARGDVAAVEPMSVLAGARGGGGGGGGGGGKGKTQETTLDSSSVDSTTDGGTSDPVTTDGSVEPVAPARAHPLQWHLDEVQAPGPDETTFDGSVVVAVLDSGVAYDAGLGGYAAAQSLADVPIVAPWDFVDGDADALDENQHGTHIASLIASRGVVEGVAPGVPLMPLRVLDEDNVGTELALVEAIHYAVDHGASILNMSLSFPYGYVPSAALRAALDRASDAGVVLVAAAGNSARAAQSWPAQSPRVIGVGAYAGIGGNADVRHVSDYSNTGSGLDLMAPGGDLSVDANHDGYVDGLLAETIRPGDPSATGLYFYQGTSQAAALVSGAVALMMQRGDDPAEIRAALQAGALDWNGSAMLEGAGAGGLRIGASLASAPPLQAGFSVVMQSWLKMKQNDDTLVRPASLVTVLDPNGEAPTNPVHVIGTLYGADGTTDVVNCKGSRKAPAVCTLYGKPVDRFDAAGQLLPHAWAVVVDSVIIDGEDIGYRPEQAIIANDDLGLLMEAMEQEPAFDDSLVAFEWTEGPAPAGRAAPALLLMDLATGTSMPPMQVIATHGALQIDQRQTYEVDLDGTGLATSPMGLYRIDRLTLSGTGLATSPMGFSRLRFATFDASGLATSPLGFSSYTMLSLEAPGWDSPLLDFDDAPVSLTTGSGLATSPLGFGDNSLAFTLSHGGWAAAAGAGGATAMSASGAVEVGLTATGDSLGAGTQAVSLDDGAF